MTAWCYVNFASGTGTRSPLREEATIRARIAVASNVRLSTVPQDTRGAIQRCWLRLYSRCFQKMATSCTARRSAMRCTLAGLGS